MLANKKLSQLFVIEPSLFYLFGLQGNFAGILYFANTIRVSHTQYKTQTTAKNKLGGHHKALAINSVVQVHWNATMDSVATGVYLFSFKMKSKVFKNMNPFFHNSAAQQFDCLRVWHFLVLTSKEKWLWHFIFLMRDWSCNCPMRHQDTCHSISGCFLVQGSVLQSVWGCQAICYQIEADGMFCLRE